MSQLLSRHHRTAQQRKPKINTLLKSSVVLITSTLLLSISTQAVEPTNSTSNATVNNTSINTSAINLAIMADSPTVLSETKRITRAPNRTMLTMLIVTKPSILKTPFIIQFGQRTAWSLPKKRLPLTLVYRF